MSDDSRISIAPSGNKFDVIVIGSGIGGLTAGSLLSRLKNKRVLILEKHFKVGGFTHTFKREGKYLWDVGVHYIGGMQKGSMVRGLFDAVTGTSVVWNRMADPFERFIFPDFSFAMHGNDKKFQADLIEMFPDEKSAIVRYFADIKSASGWFTRYFTVKMLPSFLGKATALLKYIGESSALMSAGEYMSANFRDPRLRALLVSQWGDYGLPPSKSAFVIHALIVSHYLGGGYYPAGGSGVIAEGAAAIIKSAGGEIRINHEVKEIIIKDSTAVGVRAVENRGKTSIPVEYFADAIVSDVGARNTYLKMIPPGYADAWRNEVAEFPVGAATATLYLGFKDSPAKLGLKGENHWMYSSLDHEANYLNRNDALKGSPTACYASFPSLKDTEAKSHTGELITFLDYEAFSKWKDLPWKGRGGDYEALKTAVAESMIRMADRHIPGLRELIDYQELSTPLTNEHFTSHTNGTIYGIPCTPDRFRREWIGPRTPLKNLYLAGADAATPGVVGSMMGGYAAAGLLMGMSGIKMLFKELRNSSRS